MLIPPFHLLNETVINSDRAETFECRQKYNNIVGQDGEIVKSVSSISENVGYVFRVVYKPIFEGKVLSSENIFICWKTADGPYHFVVSPINEEDALRKNMRKEDLDS